MRSISRSVPRRIPSVERFSSSACALSAAEGLVLLSDPSDPKSFRRRAPTAAVYFPRGEGARSDRVVTVSMFTAGEDALLSPPIALWSGAATSEYVQVRHAAVLPLNCEGASLRASLGDSLIVWFTEECMDDRPVSELSRRLGLTTAAGVPVQGPVVVCSFGPSGKRGWLDYAGSPVIHGTGEWVHVPTLAACVRRVPVLPKQAYLIGDGQLRLNCE